MSITVNGNNNVVAGRDNNQNSNVANYTINDIPPQHQEEYRKLLDYILQRNNSKEDKNSKVSKFIDTLLNSGVGAIVGEVGAVPRTV